MRTGLATLVCALAASAAAFPAAAGADTPEHRDALSALRQAQEYRAGIGLRTGRELTPALRELRAKRKHLGTEGKRQADALAARPDDNDYPGANGDNHYESHALLATTCSANFCIHWDENTSHTAAPAGADDNVATIPASITTMLNAFEDDVFDCENTADADCNGANGGTPTGMSWPEPKGDGADGGGVDLTDVYVIDLGPSLYGYAQIDPQLSNPQNSYFAYLVMNNDFDPFPGTADEAMKATAAHEYNHVLQFRMDTLEDSWMFESTATWAEEKVYPDVNDYLNYIDNWNTLTEQPLTAFPAGNDSIKVYGSAVWNHWLDFRYSGDDVVQSAWEQSAGLTTPFTPSFAPDAYSKAIQDRAGVGFEDEFEEFSAAVAEWRTPGSGFPDLYQDVPRVGGAITVNNATATTPTALDHTAFRFFNVTGSAANTPMTATASIPAGFKGALALIGRTGTETGGTVTKSISKFSAAGAVSATLPGGNYTRVTVVLINADVSKSGFSGGDWVFTKDNQVFSNLRVSQGPIPVTGAATAITETSATLNGTVNPQGAASTYQFEYGTDTSYGSVAPVTPGSVAAGATDNTAHAVSEAITGLTAGTTYHYRLVATNANGTRQGQDQTFTTFGPPVPVTGAATAITETSATLNGTVNPQGAASTYQFEYGTDTSYGSLAPDPTPASVASGATDQTAHAVSEAITGLTAGTTYHYRLVATNANGPIDGQDQTFTTAGPPVVTTGAATGITQTAATLNGTVNPRGQATTWHFELGTTTAYGINSANASAGSGQTASAVSAAVAGLSPDTTYHYRLVATNASGTVPGLDQTFTTAATPPSPGTTTSPTTTTTPTPTPTPTPTTGTTTPTFLFTASVVKGRLLTVLRKGLKTRASCRRACTVSAKFVISRKLARKLRLKKTTVATGRATLPASGGRITLRFTRAARKALAKLRLLPGTVTFSTRDANGRSVSLRRPIRLKR